MFLFIIYLAELLCNARNVGLKINNVERFALSTPCPPRSGMQCQGKGDIHGTAFVPKESRLSLSIVFFQGLTRSSQGRTRLSQPTRERKNRSLSRAETLENSTTLYSLLSLQCRVYLQRKGRTDVAQEVEGLFCTWKVAGLMPWIPSCTLKYPWARHQTPTWQSMIVCKEVNLTRVVVLWAVRLENAIEMQVHLPKWQ